MNLYFRGCFLLLLVSCQSVQNEQIIDYYTTKTEHYDALGVGGYDLVSYHTGTPAKGNPNHKSVHAGVSYLFQNEQNKQEFEKNRPKYLPAYGGYCAYGVAVGKKFAGEPDVWEVVDGKLYLNLDQSVKKTWLEDTQGYISKAETAWPQIKNTPAGDL